MSAIGADVFGLDFETSAIEVTAGAVPVQVGLTAPDLSVTSLETCIRLVKPLSFSLYEGSLEQPFWNTSAAKVHRLSLRAIDGGGLPAVEVDRWMEKFVAEYRTTSSKALLVGWQVGSFDLQFLNRFMPRTAAVFSHRTIDLHPLCFLEAVVSGRTYKAVKKASFEWALKNDPLLEGGEVHEAGFDSRLAVGQYRYFLEQAQGRVGASSE